MVKNARVDSVNDHTDLASAPIKLPSIPDVVYETLRTDISTGAYPPGPISIRRLAERFAVSAMPVREALRRLEAEGLVSFQGGRQVTIIELSHDDLEELFAIRRELEGLAVRTAVPLVAEDASTLALLDELIRRMDAQENDYDSWRRTNREFHTVLYQGAAMPRLLGLITSLGLAVEPYVRKYGTTVEGLRIAQEQHRELVAHTRAGDVEATAEVLERHLEIALSVLRRNSLPDGDGAVRPRQALPAED
jgi:DNA-binding GntR family transcriptional regulator